MSGLVLEFRGVQKAYGGLRPLRVQHLAVARGESVSLVGFDRAAAEVFVNLATGASMPDEGDVRLFGESTAAIADADAWLASLDRLGILSDRVVLLEALTALQNLAMPFTLEIEPLAEETRQRAARLAAEVGLRSDDQTGPAGALPPLARLRIRFGRALALGPGLVLAEHPNAAIPADDVPVFADDFARVVAARGVASVTLTADRSYAAAVGHQVLTLQPATGELKTAAGWRRWFVRR